MNRFKATASICATIAATILVSAPVAARPDSNHGKKQVCKFEKKHGKRVRVCHMVRR